MRTILVLCLALAGCSESFSAEMEIAAAELKDPSSAQFRHLTRVGNLVCGEINGKNSYGGYVGFEPFYVRDGKATLADKTGDNLIDVTNELRIVNTCADARLSQLNEKMKN
ncbi:hypothetical protein [Tsuneonella suprasediminis]|uniref:hypothetical protein n=1 Tax=Tsuneonella suprasediminis TaxID=2306996 RepID=UPI002F939B3E